MFEFLTAFEKRMQIVAIVDSILNRKNRDMEIERIFPDRQLENLVFSVLVFIMDKTLSEDEECSLGHIAEFIKGILPESYGISLSPEMYYRVAEYIVKSILQNDGAPLYYPVMNYTEGKMTELRIKLIDDRVIETDGGYKISYVLTDQGYDFLFRTKEVEQEIRFTIEELKLRELIKRKNYKKALQQSTNLIQMVRQKKKDLQQFMLKIRESIYDVEIEKFEELINSTYELLQEEYDVLSDIKNMIALSERRLREELALSGQLDEDLRKAQREITMIRNNINTTLKEQQDLILDRHNLSKIYVDTIREAFSFTLEKRFDFEEEILRKLERCTDSTLDRLWQLVNCLFLPKPYRHLNILSLFERQGRLKQEEEDGLHGIALEELAADRERNKIETANKVYITILRMLLLFAVQRGGQVRFSVFAEHLKADPQLFAALTADRLLYTTILQLYNIGTVDIGKWLTEQEEIVVNATGEFDLEYCLYKLREESADIYGISTLRISKIDDQAFKQQIVYRQNEYCVKETVEMTDFLIEVTR